MCCYKPPPNIPITKWKHIGSILPPSTTHLHRCCYVGILNNVEEDINNINKNVRCPTCGTNSHSQKMCENVGEVGECEIKTTTNPSPPLDSLHQCCINTIFEIAYKNKQNKIHNPYEDVDCHYKPCKMEEDLMKLMNSSFFGKTCEDIDEGEGGKEEEGLERSYQETLTMSSSS